MTDVHIFFFKLSIQCISYRCIRLLNQPNAQYQIQVKIKDGVYYLYVRTVHSWLRYTTKLQHEDTDHFGIRIVLED